MTSQTANTSAPLLRSFVAIPLPGAVQVAIADATRALARDLAGVKWSRKVENLHVTMKFLGPVAGERLDALGAEMGGALARVPRFGFEVRGFGAFPSSREAKIVYAGVDEDARRGLSAVAEVVETIAARFGFARETRAFSGHVTVGRSVGKGGVDARTALAPWSGHAFGAIEVDEVHVYESRLGGEGSTYVLRSRAALGASN